MDYRRTFWLLVVGAGVLSWLQAAAAFGAGAAGLQVALAALRGLAFVGLGGYALLEPGQFDGPERPGPLYLLGAVLFVAMLAVAVLEFSGS